jgi:hypothetical protein
MDFNPLTAIHRDLRVPLGRLVLSGAFPGVMAGIAAATQSEASSMNPTRTIKLISRPSLVMGASTGDVWLGLSSERLRRW